MITGNDTISYYSRSNIFIWTLMAFQAGILNIAGYLACHRFVSHITGFATLFGNEIASNNWDQAIRFLTVPIFFLLGVILSGFLIDIRIILKERPKYYLVFGLIFILILTLCMLGIFGFWGHFGEPLSQTRDYYLLALLCLICGIQNGAITSVSKYVIRTTHLTGLTTDLGIGLARILNIKKIDQSAKNEFKPTIMRIAIISFFTFGSIIGAVIFTKWHFWGFILPTINSGFLFLLMLYYQFLKKDKIESK